MTTTACQTKYNGDQNTPSKVTEFPLYEGWNFNSGNYLFTTDTK